MSGFVERPIVTIELKDLIDKVHDPDLSAIYRHAIAFYWLYKQAPALLAEIERYSWQPIDTAPKDLSEVLVSGPCLHIPGTMFVTCATYSPSRERWEAGQGKIYPPTHWMPLPAPPNADGGV